MDSRPAEAILRAPLATPTELSGAAVADISAALRGLLADVFALYVKTKSFHWHMSGPRFRDYHLVLDEQAEELLAITDPLAERARKLGGSAIRSVGEIARLKRLLDNDEPFVTPEDMLAELRDDNRQLARELREVHGLCELHRDIATASVLETYTDEAERRVWFLFEMTRHTPAGRE